MIRIIIALYFDIIRVTPSPVELLTDSALFLVFGTLLIMGLRRANFQSINPIFGLLIIVMLALNFIEFNGVNGLARFNYYSGFFVIVLLYSGSRLIYLLIFQFALLVAATLVTYYQVPWISFLMVNLPLEPTDFLFALGALGLLSFYLKGITMDETRKYEALSDTLQVKVEEEREMYETLTKQGLALQQAQQQLEQEVKRRSKSLEAQQQAIEEYIHLNTRVMKEPIQQLNQTLAALETKDNLSEMLKASGEELRTVFEQITKTLESEEELTRSKIRLR